MLFRTFAARFAVVTESPCLRLQLSREAFAVLGRAEGETLLHALQKVTAGLRQGEETDLVEGCSQDRRLLCPPHDLDDP